QQMTADLNVPVRLVICPIVREADGLARSSRNQYLDADQRQQATVLCQTLRDLQERGAGGQRHAEDLVRQMRRRIEATPGARLEYAAIVDGDTLQPVERLRRRALVALAVIFGSTRLIDNLLLDIPDHP